MSRTEFVPMVPGPRMYAVRLMHNGQSVLPTDRRFGLALDFTKGPVLLGTQAILNAALRRFLEQIRNIKPHELGSYYLEVSVWDDPRSVVCHIPVSWDIEA